MATIKPFRAIRPTRDKVALATSRSYDIYTKAELKSHLKFNPYSFLHIIKPGYKHHKHLTGEERFNLVANRYTKFKNSDIYIKDDKPLYYLHQKSFENDLFWGIIAITNVEDYQNNCIKKHENTLHDREEMFGNYLNITGFNAEPVLLTYPDNKLLNKIYLKYKQKRAEYEFTTHTKRTHLLWLIDDDEDLKNIELEFKKMDALYIADGHHRTASSNYLANKLKSENKDHTGKECYNYFMSYLISDSILKISGFNRFVKDLNGLTTKQFLNKLSEHYNIENFEYQEYIPKTKHNFSMYLDGSFYSLTLKNSNYSINNALSDLDTHIIHKTILKPILGINDLTKDKRISCLPGKFEQNKLKEQVESQKFKVGFGIYPISVTQLKAVVDENLKMPPKSTYIEPKLRSGLTIFELK